jgi:DNA (cytosine-5)-methyltransferase 1
MAETLTKSKKAKKAISSKRIQAVKKAASKITSKAGSGKQLLFQVFDVNWEYETQRIIKLLRESGALMAYIDLFCGAGGTSTGMEEAEHNGKKLACVILGINHDRKAIESHQENHPETLHLIEDIREVNLEPIGRMVEAIRRELPYIKIVLWASAECTHHSKAKGGDSRDPDSRSLAEELYRYHEAIKPDLLQVENVTEFRIWGPIIQKVIDVSEYNFSEMPHKFNHAEYGRLYSFNGKTWVSRSGLAYKKDKKKGTAPWMVPDPERKAEYFNQWVEHLKSLGYEYQDRDLNSANFGAYTARNRYFGQFSRELPIQWPAITHAKHPEKYDVEKYGRLQPYKAVREVLDFDDKGESIFIPGRITSPQTFKRILQGCIKFIAGGKKEYEAFLMKYNSTSSNGVDVQNSSTSIDDVSPTVATQDRIAKVEVEIAGKDVSFMQSYHNGEGTKGEQVHSVDEPNKTVDTQNRFAFTTAQFNSVDEPMRTLTQKEKFGVAGVERVHFIQQRNTGDPQSKVISVDGWLLNPSFDNVGTSLEEPAHTVLASRKHAYIVNPSYQGNCHDVDAPSPVVVARQDKSPLHLCQIEYGDSKFYAIIIYSHDCEEIRELKRFMAAYNIVDIKMRMLKVLELLRIQGFPATYVLKGSQTDQKKFIGNSVEVKTARKLAECYGPVLESMFNTKINVA